MNRMNRSMLLPGLALVGGAAAFVLRALQNRTGFEAATGLPISGNLWGMALMAVLVVLAVGGWVVSRQVPDEQSAPPASFQAVFASPAALPVTLVIAGLFLMALSGVTDLAGGLGIALPGPDGAYEAEAYLPVQRDMSLLLSGILSLLLAASQLVAAAKCRTGSRAPRDESSREPNPNLLLAAPICLVVRLVLTYRDLSVNPSISTYYVEILALVFMTLAFYRLSSFGFQCGRTRRFFQYAGAAVVLSLASLADGGGISTLLFYAGGALSLWGWMLQRLSAPDSPQA